MYLYTPHNKIFNSRKEAKLYLGGTNQFKKALRDKQIYIINYKPIADNGTIYNNTKTNK